MLYCAAVETLDHVLCSGEVASKVWDYFALHFNLRMPHVASWRNHMNLWWSSALKSTQIVPLVITWALWIARCASHMEGTNF